MAHPNGWISSDALLAYLTKKIRREGISRYSMECTELQLDYNSAPLLHFDGPGLYGLYWGKWDLVHMQKASNVLSGENVPKLEVPSGLIAAMMIEMSRTGYYFRDAKSSYCGMPPTLLY